MDIALTEALAADLDRLDPLVAAYHAFERITLAPDQRRAALAEILSKRDLGRVYLIENAGAVAGYAVLTFGFSIELGGRDAFIDELFLRPEARGRGIGSAALSLISNAARKAGVKALHLEVGRANAPAKAFYARLGFSARAQFHLMTLKF